MRRGDEIMLATAPEYGTLVESLIKEELSKDLGKAGMETLAIVLYLGPVSRSRIDYIRGVHSHFILRNLLVRGLVEKIPHPEDKRAFLYRPTIDLLRHLGIARAEDLPDYNTVREEVENFERAAEKEDGARGESAERAREE